MNELKQEQSSGKLKLPHPKKEGEIIEEFILIYKDNDGNDMDDLGYRAFLQTGETVAPGELLFCGSQILAEIMSAQDKVPFVESLGTKLIQAIEEFAELLAKLDKIRDKEAFESFEELLEKLKNMETKGDG